MKQVRIGGQAVLEGIMMKGPTSYSLAVRKSDGEIALQVTPYRSITERKKMNKIPIVRGVISFVESLYIGIKTLMASSEYFDEDEETKSETPAQTPAGSETVDATLTGRETADASPAGPETVDAEGGTDAASTGSDAEKGKKKEKRKDKKEEKKEGKKEEKENKAAMVGTLLFSLLFAIGLFVLLPSFLAGFLLKITDQQWIANLTEGILRLLIFLGYVALISRMEDIRRTFMYHGAEHKAINCLEAGDDLTPENVLKHTRFHKRCGTSFVFIVMIISILVFMLVHTETMWIRMLSRILLIPLIAGISYEVLQYAGRHENACSRIMSAPGLWVQRLTTKEPDLSMAEVAVRAVEQVIDVKEYLNCVRNNSFEK